MPIWLYSVPAAFVPMVMRLSSAWAIVGTANTTASPALTASHIVRLRNVFMGLFAISPPPNFACFLIEPAPVSASLATTGGTPSLGYIRPPDINQGCHEIKRDRPFTVGL